ncbi:MAG: phage major capsid protein [Mogibacterium sp.]|nr:phage major capsid protein [Mogibacterium sp.]
MLRTLMLRKELDDKTKMLTALRAKDAEFERRQAELETAIAEAETEEQKNVVREAIDTYDNEKAEHEQAKTDLDEEVRNLETELDELESKQEKPAADPEPAPAPAAEPEARKERTAMNMKTRSVFKGMTREDRTVMMQREDVQGFLEEVRTGIREKRAITNVGLLIPEVVLPLLRENILEYSKLYKHVNVVAVSGEGRQPIMGTIPEAVWTDCCANLNEMDLAFNDTEINCWKVGGFYAICNANIEDSDIDLLGEIIVALGAGIGLALDKAILYGTGTRMPLGVVTRLAQTAQPADYPATARPWVDLHTSNIKTIASGKTGPELFAEIVSDFGAAKGKYSRGDKVFVMNEATYTALAAAAISVDAAGNIVTGVLDRMPVIGGAIEVLDFVQDNVIIGGFFDLYLLGERAGQKFATSEHVRFLNDQTVMKGTARYDGKPSIAEGFVAIGLNGATPSAEMTFAPDDANAEQESE